MNDTPRQVRLGRLWVDAVTFEGALDAIEAMVESGRGGAVFTPNVDHVVNAETDAALVAAYEICTLSVADGKPLVWASRLLRDPLPEKISGSDLAVPLAVRAARKGHRIYLIGGGPGVADEAAAILRKGHGANIVGTDSPMLGLTGSPAEDAAVEKIRAARPDLVMVAFGAPKQELFIQRAWPKVPAAVWLGIGGTFDFIAGRVRRAPLWMQESGLEWAYRLAQEPRRLWKRYLINDPKFALVLARMLATPRRDRTRLRPARAP